MLRHLRNDFLDSQQPFFVIIKLHLDSNKSRRIKKQTENRQSCPEAYWNGGTFPRHLVVNKVFYNVRA